MLTYNKDATISGAAYIEINNSTRSLEQRAEQLLMLIDIELAQYRLEMLEIFYV